MTQSSAAWLTPHLLDRDRPTQANVADYVLRVRAAYADAGRRPGDTMRFCLVEDVGSACPGFMCPAENLVSLMIGLIHNFLRIRLHVTDFERSSQQTYNKTSSECSCTSKS